MYFKNFTQGLSNKCDQVIQWVVVPAMAFYTLLIFVGVLSRFVFKIPIMEAVELSRLGFVWACLLGASVAYKRMAHINFTVISSRLPSKASKILSLTINVISLVFMIWVLYYSVIITTKVWPSKLSATGLSNGLMYISLPITMIAMIIHCINYIVQDFSRCTSKGEL